MRSVTLTASLFTIQWKNVVMLFSANVRTMRLIMSSACVTVVGSWSLLTTFVHSEHRSAMSTINVFCRFNIDLYLLTGTLVLIVINGVTNIGSELALCVLSGFGTRPTKGPGIPESCASVARGCTHICKGNDGGVVLAGGYIGRPLCLCQRILRTNALHYDKLIGWKYFDWV